MIDHFHFFVLHFLRQISPENETQLKKKPYTRKIQLTSVKESIIPFSLYLSSKSHSQLDELFIRTPVIII
jgi:hypothetical protein